MSRLLSAVMLFGWLVVGGRTEVPGQDREVQPYLGSYQVEDSCQFQLCGAEYSEEFTAPGATPRVGSCSGDCHLMATNMNTNKFHREFLWSQCSRMCSRKFPPATVSSYKPRFVCMEQCYHSYQLLSPHHSLARYCIQASCPLSPGRPVHQVDCFSSCASHVSTRVDTHDWQSWASALAGSCQQETQEEGAEMDKHHRLLCADRAVWSSVSSPLSSHCLQDICQDDIKCGRTCLSHVEAVEEENRPVWRECSSSVVCGDMNQGDKMACADRCLEQHREEEIRRVENTRREEEMRREEEKRRRQQQRKQQALSSVHSGSPSLLLSPLLLLAGLAYT